MLTLSRSLQIEIGKRELEFVQSISTSLYWQLRRPPSGMRQTKNGSAFFLNFGNGPIAVTAAHVLAEYRRDKDEFERIGNLRFGGADRCSIPIDEGSRLIDEDTQIDVATLRVTQEELDILNRNMISLPADQWPPDVVAVDSDILLCGFPGTSRRDISARQFHAGVFAWSGSATSVSDNDISMHFDRSELVGVMGQGIPPEDFDFGGVSGGPVLSIIRSPIRRMMFAGVVYQGPSPSYMSDQSIAGLEIFRARRAHFICADGTLDHRRWYDCNPGR